MKLRYKWNAKWLRDWKRQFGREHGKWETPHTSALAQELQRIDLPGLAPWLLIWVTSR